MTTRLAPDAPLPGERAVRVGGVLFGLGVAGVLLVLVPFFFGREDAPPTLAAARRSADELQGMVEDMIKLLEGRVQPSLRRGKHPDRDTGRRIAQIMRAVAAELEG